jgi:hypothetical protein
MSPAIWTCLWTFVAEDEDEDDAEDSSHSPGTGSAPVGFRQFMNWSSNTECSS